MERQRIKKILVPLDGSKNSSRGLDKAIYLARQCGATITGLCVIPLYSIKLGNPGRILTPLRNETAKQAKKFMAEAKRAAAQRGIVFNEKLLYGNGAWEIVEFATSKKFDLIVIGSRGLNPIKQAFLGSVTNAVVHRSKTPVLVVK